MTDIKPLSASLEDYLETIYHVVAEKQAARAKDIAKRLEVNNSSVTGALRSLSEKGFINYAPYDLITLTQQGKTLAEDIVRRHEALQDFFTKILCINEDEAEKAACEMEHSISRPILNKLISFVDFIELCPRGGNEWIKSFKDHCEMGGSFSDCDSCLNKCMTTLQDKRDRLESEASQEMPLYSLEPGLKGKITKISPRSDIGKKLAELEVKPGNIIKVENVSDTENTLEVKVKGYRLTVRKDEAAKISVASY